MLPVGRCISRRYAIFTNLINALHTTPSAPSTGMFAFTTSSKHYVSRDNSLLGCSHSHKTVGLETSRSIVLSTSPRQTQTLLFKPTTLHSITNSDRLQNEQLPFSSVNNAIHFNFPTPSSHQGSCKLPPCFEIFEQLDEVTEPVVAPPGNSVHEKRAARLIVIRKRKMKKHKLQKLRKKMKFEWAKVRQRREMRKEKAFQGELLAQIKEAEKFDAAQYVAEKLRQAHEVPIPRTWKGKRLPEFIIKQKLGLK